MKYIFGIPAAGACPGEFDHWEEQFGSGMIFKKVLYNRLLGGPGSWCDNMRQAAEKVADAVLSTVGEGDEIYLFGHCMGANIAYEAAALLQREKSLPVKALLFVAFISPDVPIEDGISHLDDDSFIEELHKEGRFPEEFFINRSLLKFLLPGIRADYRLIENYCDTRHYVLDCPIIAFFAEDDEMVLPSETAGWPAYTSRQFISRTFPGGHFFLFDTQEEVINSVRQFILELDEADRNAADMPRH